MYFDELVPERDYLPEVSAMHDNVVIKPDDNNAEPLCAAGRINLTMRRHAVS